MIILRFLDLISFLKSEYGIKVSQREFSEISGIPPDRISRLNKQCKQNVNTKLLNQVLEGSWKLILNSQQGIKEVGEVKNTDFGETVEVDREDIFRKLVRTLVDYIPDSDNSMYLELMKTEENRDTFLKRYSEPVPLSLRVNWKNKLLNLYNKKFVKIPLE